MKPRGNPSARINPDKLSFYYDLGQRFGELEVIAYCHSNGNIYDYPENDNETRMFMYIKYKVYCHLCGTSKLVDQKNLLKVKTCGCKSARSARNFNWTGKSKNI